MEYSRISVSQADALWELQNAYKAEIEEAMPSEQDLNRLKEAMKENRILFYGAWDGMKLAGCCSVTIGFSTFNYAASGVFEDFYIRPEYRHKGIARDLVRYVWQDSGAETLTVGCADCDVEMYRSLGFSIHLGNLLAYE